MKVGVEVDVGFDDLELSDRINPRCFYTPIVHGSFPKYPRYPSIFRDATSSVLKASKRD